MKNKKSLVVIKKFKRSNNIVSFSAWCSEKAYNYPDKIFVCKKTKAIALFSQGAYLAKFYFHTDREYKNALRIAKRALNNSRRGKSNG
jgi:hypothetical protein